MSTFLPTQTILLYLTFNTLLISNILSIINAGKHVVFGKVMEGMDIVKIMEETGSPSGKPSKIVKIKDCGQL